MVKLDAKFYGEIHKAKNDQPVPEDQYVVFLAKDSIFAEVALPVYLAECIRRGCDMVQVEAVSALLSRVHIWRTEHPEECHDPDAAGEKMLVNMGIDRNEATSQKNMVSKQVRSE